MLYLWLSFRWHRLFEGSSNLLFVVKIWDPLPFYQTFFLNRRFPCDNTHEPRTPICDTGANDLSQVNSTLQPKLGRNRMRMTEIIIWDVCMNVCAVAKGGIALNKTVLQLQPLLTWEASSALIMSALLSSLRMICLILCLTRLGFWNFQPPPCRPFSAPLAGVWGVPILPVVASSCTGLSSNLMMSSSLSRILWSRMT